MKVQNITNNGTSFKKLFVNVEPGNEGIFLSTNGRTEGSLSGLRLITHEGQTMGYSNNNGIEIGCTENIKILKDEFKRNEGRFDEKTARGLLSKIFDEPEIKSVFVFVCNGLHKEHPNKFASGSEIFAKIKNTITNGKYESSFCYGHLGSSKFASLRWRK